MERRWNLGRLVATGAVVLFVTAIALNDGRFETQTVEPVVTERVTPRPAADRDEMVSPEELAQLQSRWRTVLEQGWIGAEATGMLVTEVLPESEAAESEAAESEVAESEAAEPEAVVALSAVDEAEAPEEAEEQIDDDAEVEDTPIESTANAQLEEQIASLQLELDALTSRVAAVELDNQMLVTATDAQRDQIAFLRMQLALRALAR